MKKSLCNIRWSEKKLRHCIRSTETFSEQDIVSSTQRQLTWNHLKSLMYIKDSLERQFHAIYAVWNIGTPVRMMKIQKAILNMSNT